MMLVEVPYNIWKPAIMVSAGAARQRLQSQPLRTLNSGSLLMAVDYLAILELSI
jgi:hypothetical protein